ncbi:MAG: TrmH family RNA methyltransferase [Porticoccaceae bacterium]
MNADQPTPTVYAERKRFFDRLLTLYGRKPVLEALQDADIPVYRLHLADSNRREGIINAILALAQQRGVEIVYHSRAELSRISRNQRQDQGVAIDLRCPNYRDSRELIDQRDPEQPFQLIALDRITNPQNLGMIIRSVCASPLTGLLLPSSGCAPLSPLVIKASAGTLLRCPIFRCTDLADTLPALAARGADICVLSADGGQLLGDYRPTGSVVYVLGNETEGASPAIERCATRRLCIPMANGVESLNVAVAAALIAFRDVLTVVR